MFARAMLLALSASLTLVCAAVADEPRSPEHPDSPIHPKKFGVANHRVDEIRGWYVWKAYDPLTREAEVTKDPPGGETYRVRVLPWATTYRRLVYGARPDDLLPGERVNLFFSADERHPRGWLVHYQDEIGQMKGHGASWEVRKVDAGGFVARTVAHGKPIDDKELAFRFDPGCRVWRQGARAEKPNLAAGDQVYLAWGYRGDVRTVWLMADAASLEPLRKEFEAEVDARAETEGLAGRVASVEGVRVSAWLYAGGWAQAGKLKPGQRLRLSAVDSALRPTGPSVAVTLGARKNLGAFGSGVTDLSLTLAQPADAARVAEWAKGATVRLLAEPQTIRKPPEGFVAIFNGKNLDGWDGSAKYWSVEDGALTGVADGKLTFNRFIVWRGGTVKNFELRVQVRVTPGGNSGLQYRSVLRPDLGESVVVGYQCDVVANRPDYNGMLYEERGRRILAHAGEKVVVDPEGQPWVVGKLPVKTFPAGEWHDFRVLVEGNRHRHWIDEHPTVEVVDLDAKGRRLDGVLGVQVHVGPPMKIQYRDFFLRRLPDDLPILGPGDAPIPKDAVRVVPQGTPKKKKQ